MRLSSKACGIPCRAIASLLEHEREFYVLSLRCLSTRAIGGKDIAMGNNDDKLTREERLAAKLRENLRRRKAQARAMDDENQPEKRPKNSAAPSQNGSQ
jgi:hypothetical protein